MENNTDIILLGNVSQLNSSGVGYSTSKPVAAIPGIRQTNISPQTMNQGRNIISK